MMISDLRYLEGQRSRRCGAKDDSGRTEDHLLARGMRRFLRHTPDEYDRTRRLGFRCRLVSNG